MANKKKKSSASSADTKKKKQVRLSGNESESIGMDVLCADVSTSVSVSKSETKDILDAFWLAVQDHISKGRSVNIHGVGTFKGQRRNVKGKTQPVVKFALSSAFKKSVIEKVKNVSVFPLYKSKAKFPTEK